MPRLSTAEFEATFTAPMIRVAQDEEPPCQFWDYFDTIPEADFSGYDCSNGRVSFAWRHPSGRYEHVLISSQDRDVFMVLVLDVTEKRVLGHHLLDLPKLYGLPE